MTYAFHPYRGEAPCPRCGGHRLANQHQGYDSGRRTPYLPMSRPSRTRERIEVGIFAILFILGLFGAVWVPVQS